jgi:hypothetical protein
MVSKLSGPGLKHEASAAAERSGDEDSQSALAGVRHQ